jgi:AraC-type DNA-binding domain-containing proteins
LNYYELVQRAIDFIESNLETEIDLQIVAKKAFMSLASLYRLFFSMTGCTVKEYIRRRRIARASYDLIYTGKGILDISVNFCFESQAAFTRSFKQLTGFTPGACRKSKSEYKFERVNLMAEYFEIQNKELMEKYPDIKVIKELKPLRVAYYRHIGKTPERDAWAVLKEWIIKNRLDKGDSKMRIFGFNNPNPSFNYVPGQSEYGYEFMVTIDSGLAVEDAKVAAKMFSGGRYAVMSISNVNGDGIARAWVRFNRWLKDSKYVGGSHQCLEEHLFFGDEGNQNMKLDLYMPLAPVDKTVGSMAEQLHWGNA